MTDGVVEGIPLGVSDEVWLCGVGLGELLVGSVNKGVAEGVMLGVSVEDWLGEGKLVDGLKDGTPLGV